MEKVKRARHLIDELELRVKDYFAGNPYKIATKKDSINGRLVYYIENIKDLPVEIKTITGDVIQNLRSSLDHVAYILFIKAGGKPMAARHVYFPIVENEKKFKDKSTKGKMTGLSSAAINAITAVRPYKEGNLKLWQLHQLNNIDKHRLLLTAGSSFGSIDIAPHMQMLVSDISVMKDIVIPPIFLKPADNLFPLKQGDELFVDSPDAIPNSKISFNIQLVLNEAGIVEKQVLVPFLGELADEAETVVNSFKSLL